MLDFSRIITEAQREAHETEQKSGELIALLYNLLGQIEKRFDICYFPDGSTPPKSPEQTEAEERIGRLITAAENIGEAAREAAGLLISLGCDKAGRPAGAFMCMQDQTQKTLAKISEIKDSTSWLESELAADAQPLSRLAASDEFERSADSLRCELAQFEERLSHVVRELTMLQEEAQNASNGHSAAGEEQDKALAPKLSEIQFSVVAPKRTQKGTYLLFSIYMYEDAYRSVVDEALGSGAKKQEHRSGVFGVADETYVRITVDSPDLHESETEAMYWKGKYLRFDFAPSLPEDFRKDRVLFAASVYFNGILATKLIFDAAVGTGSAGRLRVGRNDIRSAFISYASEDLAIVANALQGMKKVRPDLDVFFDRDSLRSGDLWERVIKNEIDSRDMLYLFWSRNARNSEWVDMEWRYALKNRGVDFIDPFPIESPDVCPPPEELNMKHFNDREILYYRGSRPTEP